MDFFRKMLWVLPVYKNRAIYLDWYENTVEFDGQTRENFDDKSRYAPPPYITLQQHPVGPESQFSRDILFELFDPSS